MDVKRVRPMRLPVARFWVATFVIADLFAGVPLSTAGAAAALIVAALIVRVQWWEPFALAAAVGAMLIVALAFGAGSIVDSYSLLITALVGSGLVLLAADERRRVRSVGD